MKDHRLLEKVKHDDVKEFAKNKLAEKGVFKSVYVTSLMVTGFLFAAAVGYGISILIFSGETALIIQVIPGLLFSFTILIILHELIHAFGYKLSGAKSVYFGAIPSKFVFYAGSDQEVLNGHQYRFIAILPFATISTICLIALIGWPEYFVFTLTILFVHTAFCGGDFAMLNFIQKYNLSEIQTYDHREKRETYFYLK